MNEAVLVNARWLHQEPSGVGRYATEVTRRLTGIELVSPPPSLARGALGKAWEQLALARHARDCVLWSPSGSGPVAHRRHHVTIHDLFALTRPDLVSGRFAAAQRRMLPALAARAATVLTPSVAVAAEIVSVLGVVPARVEVVAPGVGPPFGAQRAPDDDGLLAAAGIDELPLVLGLLSAVPRKDPATTISVLAGLAEARPDLQVVAAGRGGPSRVFGRSSRPNTRGVRDLGAVDDAALAALLRAARLVVSLPLAEGFGLHAVEALACGAPLVSTAVPSLVEHAPGAAVLVEPGSVEAATRAGFALLADAAERADRAATGIAATAPLTWERAAEGVAGIIGASPTASARPTRRPSHVATR